MLNPCMTSSPGTATSDQEDGSRLFAQNSAGGDRVNFQGPLKLSTGFATPVVRLGRGTSCGLGHTSLACAAQAEASKRSSAQRGVRLRSRPLSCIMCINTFRPAIACRRPFPRRGADQAGEALPHDVPGLAPILRRRHATARPTSISGGGFRSSLYWAVE